MQVDLELGAVRAHQLETELAAVRQRGAEAEKLASSREDLLGIERRGLLAAQQMLDETRKQVLLAFVKRGT